LIRAVLFCVAVIVVFTLLQGGILYTEKIFCTREYSYGLTVDEQIFFLSSLHRYRKPKGLARFPDGGRVKTVYAEISLFSYHLDRKSLERHARVAARMEAGTNIKGTRLKVKDGFLNILYQCNNHIKDPASMNCVFRYSLKNGILEKITEPVGIESANRLFKNYWNEYRDRLIPISKLKNVYLNHLDQHDWDSPGD